MIRNAEDKDAAAYAEWLAKASDINLVDRGVYTYPTAQHLVVERDGVPQLMNSCHAVLVMEALAPRPGITPRQEARALNELFEKVKEVARAAGIKEIVFGCKDERLGKFIERRGFERLSFPCFRFKV
jgi:N-acetylglutamate synthase-like GNAT family acetyltransferase